MKRSVAFLAMFLISIGCTKEINKKYCWECQHLIFNNFNGYSDLGCDMSKDEAKTKSRFSDADFNANCRMK